MNIPWNFQLLNLERVYDLGEHSRKAYVNMKPEKRADACTKCGECEPKCPQNIEIRKQLEEVHRTLG